MVSSYSKKVSNARHFRSGRQMTNDFDRARFGPFEVDLHTREFWKFGTRLKLVGQPFRDSECLVDAHERARYSRKAAKSPLANGYLR